MDSREFRTLDQQPWSLYEVWGGGGGHSESCWDALSLIMRAVFICSWRPGVVTPLGGAAASLVVCAVKSSLNTLVFGGGGGGGL